MSEHKHGEPWGVDEITREMYSIATGYQMASREDKARAVLCVNACAGMSDEEVEKIKIKVAQAMAGKIAVQDLKADLDEAMKTIIRLSSGEGFKAIGHFPDDMWGDEIKARIDFARAFLAKHKEDK